MIRLRRAAERVREGRGKHEVWATFATAKGDGAAGFGALARFDEERLPPGAAVHRHAGPGVEVVLHVHEGTLAYADAGGSPDIARAGEFQRLSAGGAGKPSQSNASRSDWARLFHIWLRHPQAGLAAGHEQRRFSAGERRGGLCVVASPDGQRGSLRLHQDARVFSALLEPGQHLVHELAPARGAWLHVVAGVVDLAGERLLAGDSLGLVAEASVSLTAHDHAEVLLVDLAEPPAQLD